MKTLTSLTLGLLILTITTPLTAQDKKPDAKSNVTQPEAVSLGRPVDFEKDILPIFDSNCIACHNVAIAESKLILEDVESILKGGKRGPSVVPKQPEKSLLLNVATHAAQPVMPPAGNKVDADRLTAKELGLLKQWIVEGAKESANKTATVINWQPLSSQLNAIYGIAVSPWGDVAAAGRANRITIYDVAGGRELTTVTDPNLLKLTHNNQPMYGPGIAHRDFVHALEFSPDGKLLASGGFRVVKLWKRSENTQQLQMDLGAEATSIAVSDDEKVIAVALPNNNVKIFQLADGKPVIELTGEHTSPVQAMQFTADNKQLITASAKHIIIWNFADGKWFAKVETPADIRSLTLKKDGTQIATGHADNKIRVWKTPTELGSNKPGELVKELNGHSGSVNTLKFWLNDSQLISGSEDSTVRTWTPSNGRQVRSINAGGPVTAIALKPDNKAVAVVCRNGVAKIFDPNNSRQLAELKGTLTADREVIRLTDEQAVATQRVKLRDDDLKAADKNVKDRETGVTKSKEAKTAAEKALAEAKKKADDAKKAQDAAKVALDKKPEDNNLKKKFTDAEKKATTEADAMKRAETALQAAERGIERSEQSLKDAKAGLEAAKKDKADAEAHKKAMDAALTNAKAAVNQPKKPLLGVAFTPDGKGVITAGEDNEIRTWNPTDGSPVDVFAGHTAAITNLVVLDNGSVLTGSKDKTARVWNLTPPWELVATLGTPKDAPLDVANSEFTDRVVSLSFSRDGKQLAAGSGEPSRSGEILIFNVENFTLTKKLADVHSDSVLGLDFSWDGKLIVSGAADKFVKVHEVATGKHIRSYEGHTNHVLDVAFQANGSSIVSAGADNAIKVWNAATGEQKRTISNYSKQVTSIQFLGTGDNIVSCGGDKTVRYHRTTNGQNYRNFGGGTDFMYSVAATRDEKIVVAGGESGIVRVWNGTNGQSLFTFNPPPPPEEGTQANAGEE